MTLYYFKQYIFILRAEPGVIQWVMAESNSVNLWQFISISKLPAQTPLRLQKNIGARPS